MKYILAQSDVTWTIPSLKKEKTKESKHKQQEWKKKEMGAQFFAGLDCLLASTENWLQEADTEIAAIHKSLWWF